MKERTLRRRCKRELQALDIQPPLQVDALCRELAQHRGRPIHLVPYSLPVPGPFGIWIATSASDYIIYQRETTKPHQDHIILHEVGHILAGHDGVEDLWGLMMPDIAPQAIRRALRRTSYDQEHEREAELVATIILQWASVLNRVAPPPPEDMSVRRLHTALGDRQGWL
ncbi:hypothetical protein OHS70_38670 (plasmid) [Streptomyces sp. NBC_00390]|uniref:hypothetical protein n=1 Tax=Streptomyces sp. NBC_00390 TaxID=2975736 RepID=UPI002E23E6E0